MLIQRELPIQRNNHNISDAQDQSGERLVNLQIVLSSQNNEDESSDKQKQTYLNMIVLNDRIDAVRRNYLNRKNIPPLNESIDTLTTFINHNNYSVENSTFLNYSHLTNQQSRSLFSVNIDSVNLDSRNLYSVNLDSRQHNPIPSESIHTRKVFDSLTKKLNLFQQSLISQRDKSFKYYPKPKLLKSKHNDHPSQTPLIDLNKSYQISENLLLVDQENKSQAQDKEDFSLDLEHQMSVMRGKGNHLFDDPFINVHISFV